MRFKVMFGTLITNLFFSHFVFERWRLQHSHILLVNIITTDKVKNVICEEIPDQTSDPDLYMYVSWNDNGLSQELKKLI